MLSPAHFSDLRSLFDARCERSRRDVAVAQLRSDGSVSQALTYAELHSRVGALAARLVAHTQPGDRVLLLLPAGVSWVLAFWACVVSGRVAVPLADPRADRHRSGMDRLRDFAQDAGASVVCAPPDHPLQAAGAVEPGWTWLTLAAEPPEGDWPDLPHPRGTDLAYLQYTSGSTGQPRGVMISHANVLAQGGAVLPRWKLDESSRTLCWLPLFHDYGLVSGVLVPFMAGGRVDLYPTQSFLKDPLNWWRVASARGSTHTGGPHFAYAASLRAMQAQPGWRVDLSALRCVSCGAEPIHAQTVQAWWQATEPMGLRPEAFAPGYGMAETVLGLTSLEPMSAQRARLISVDEARLRSGHVSVQPEGVQGGVRALVSCGLPVQGVELRIVCPETQRTLGESRVGEVWVRGETVGLGYWGRPELSRETFAATTAEGDGPWLRTGDLGCLIDGELCITGRSKDLIIVHGRNVYPQDIEWTAVRAHPACVDGGGAVFAVEGASPEPFVEQLVLVQEVVAGTPAEALAGLAADIRASVALAHELPLHAVVLVRRGRLPRTSSGKVRRRQTRSDWLAGELRDVWLDDRLSEAAQASSQASSQEATQAQDPVEALVRATWQGLLGDRPMGPEANFFELGGNSLTAAQAMARLGERLGRELPLSWAFEHPTLAGVSQVIRERGLDGAARSLPPMTRLANRDARMPASHSQRRMWLVQHLEPGTTAYNIPLAVRLKGHLDVAALGSAFKDLCQRHEAFRLRHGATQGQVWQELAPCEVPEIEHVDAEALQASQPGWQLDAWLKQASSRVFDLDRLPLHQFTLIRLGDREHVLLWVLHHIIVDQWSATVLWRELAELYNAGVLGRASRLPEKSFDIVDHAHWQHEALQGPVLARQLAHWRCDLAGLAPAPLPTDRSWRVGQHLGGALVTRGLDEGFVSGLKAFSASQGCTPYMVMLACLSMLIARHTHAHDVVVATPVANRRLVDSEGIVGTLVNTLAMRNQVDEGMRFADFLAQVRGRTLEAWAHQDLPFDHLVEQLGADHRARRLPLGIEVMLNLPNAPLGDIGLEGLGWEVVNFERGSTQFPLAFMVDLDITPQAGLEYADTLFHASTARRWLDQFLSLLRQVMADPQQALSAYPLISDADRQALAAWNDTRVDLPASLRADDMVLQGIGQSREGVVVLPATGAQVGAAELKRRVHQIARALFARGVRRGDRVGLFMGRNIDTPASMLAVWQVGAAFVPLDPAFPEGRLADSATDAALKILLTDRVLRPSAHWFGGPVLVLEEIGDAAGAGEAGFEAPGFEPPHGASPDDTAYLIYTSGSTGRPKGVEVSHACLVNFLRAMARVPGLSSADRVLAVTTLSFDIALLEILLPLSQGASVVLADRRDVVDGRVILRLIGEHDITFMQATPATWRMLLTAGWRGRAGFKALVGGEALGRDLAEMLLERTAELWNMYGPTETTVWSSCARVSPADLEQGIHIGRPIDNTQIWVLDEQGRLCPPGLPGEICIGGKGVAKGYWRRPELTAERFVPDPFSAEPNARLYRTGDLGRWRHDGQIEHLGRMDGQVKLRGHRVELGEIEAVLSAHAGVRQCVASVVEVGPGDARLVAHVVPVEAMPSARDLREFMRTKLPEYMLPQVFAAIEAVPVLPNGKTDRRALPSPDFGASHASTQAARQEPLTPAEQRIAEIWSELLGGVEVSAQDNFFDLGGHSLLAMRAVSEIEARLGFNVLPRQLVFESLGQIAASCSAPPARREPKRSWFSW
jgi:amino acid adenylation domain-containing protein